MLPSEFGKPNNYAGKGRGGPALLCGFEFQLKQQLQGKLNLPCGAEVAHGEPRAENFAERGAGYGVDGVAEVGMVENVEHLGAELQVEPLRDFRVLYDGEVGVDEGRARQRIASGASGMATSGDDRIDVVARGSRSRVLGGRAERAGNRIGGIRYIGTVRNCWRFAGERCSERLAEQCVAIELGGPAGAGNRPELIRPHGERRAGRRTNDEKRRNWIAVLGHGHHAELPSGDEAIALERQLIEAADDDPVARVEFGGSVIAAWIVNVLNGNGIAGTDRAVIEGMRVGVGGQKLEAVGKMFIERDPQGVVIGISRTENSSDIADGARWIGSRALGGENRTGERQSGIGARVDVETVPHERLIEVAGHLQVRGLQTYIGDLQSQGRGEFAFDGEIPILRVHIVEIRIDRAGTEAEADDGGGRILQRDGVRRGVDADGHSEGRIAAERADDVGGRVLAQDGIGGADGSLAILEGIPGEADAGFEVFVVGVKRMGRGDERAGREIEIGEAGQGFGWSGIPFVAQAEIDGEVGPPFEAILREHTVGRLQDAVISSAEQDREGGRLIGEEIRHGGIGEAADVFGDVVVVGATDFAAESHGVTILEPAKRVVDDDGGVAAALWFGRGTAEIHVAGDVDVRYADAHGRAGGQPDIEIRWIQRSGRKDEVNAVVAQPDGVRQRRTENVVFANGHELTEAVAGIAEARDIGRSGATLGRFLAEILLHDVIEMQLVTLAQLHVDISGALVQTDVGKSRTAKAVKVRGNPGLVRSLVVRRGDEF